jgi:hypothetical protein
MQIIEEEEKSVGRIECKMKCRGEQIGFDAKFVQ